MAIKFNNEPFHFTADPRLIEMVDKYGREEGFNRTGTIREALAHWLRARGVSKADIYKDLAEAAKQ